MHCIAYLHSSEIRRFMLDVNIPAKCFKSFPIFNIFLNSPDGCEMPEPYKVEVRDPPHGIAPPHQQGGNKKNHPDHSMNRLR